MASTRHRRTWLLWGLASLLLLGYFAVGLAWPGAAQQPLFRLARVALLPGATTHGHHQIELACESCHGEGFGGTAVVQEACVGCHGKTLDAADDKHPARKFNDPRNAFRLEKIDATMCVSCHVEHRPRITKAMGLTQPVDFCFHCHSGKEEMPPSHADLPFDGCLASGCHNYHDNRALYEDFLLKHADAQALLDKRLLPQRSLLESLQQIMSYPMDRYPFEALKPEQADAPANWLRPAAAGSASSGHAGGDLLATRHAQAGVNCSACHRVGASLPEGEAKPADAGHWLLRPPTPQACVGCHGDEARGFEQGLHGMRLRAGLSPMTPAQARLPMKPDAAHRELTCTSCHGAHDFDSGPAASVQACLACHDDSHSRAYLDSPHHKLLVAEQNAALPPGSGVSCASCHMPRMRLETSDGSRPGVQHNQSLTLQPNEKMVRPVCLNCHGLGFALDAMADRPLIDSNFSRAPKVHVDSIAMALRKQAQDRARRAADSGADTTTPDKSPP